MGAAPVPRLRSDVKVRVGTDAVFEWVSPGPLAQDLLAPLTPPNLLPVTLTVEMPAGPVVLPLVGQTVPTVVSAVSDDRRELTLAQLPVIPQGWAGRNGDAWLVTPRQALPCRVVDVVAGGTFIVPTQEVTLSDPLPRDVSVSGAYLVLSRREVVLPGTVTGALVRDVLWRVDYHTRDGWGSTLSAVPRSETGLLHVVAQPFDPGVTSQDLTSYLRGIASASSSGEQGWEAQLSGALADLALHVRFHLMDRGLTEDDFPAPQRLRDVLLDLAGARILDLTEPEQSDRLRARALERLEMVMRALPWVDQDQDGQVDPGEVAQVGGSWARDFRSSRPASATRLFRVGGSH